MSKGQVGLLESSLISGHLDLDTVKMAQGKSVKLGRGLRGIISVLNLSEELSDSSNDIRGLGKSVLLTKTDSRSTVEGEVLPASGDLLSPSLRSEDVAVVSPELGSSVHGEDVVNNGVTLSDKNGLGLVGSTTSGESGISSSISDVKRDGGVESESLVDDVSQVLTSLQALKGNNREIGSIAKVLVDLSSELLPNLGVSGKLVNNPRKNTSSSITASKENVKGLVSENNRVLDLSGELTQENVLVVILLVIRVGKGLLDVVINKLVNTLGRGKESSGSPDPVKHLESGSDTTMVLGGVEILLEGLSHLLGHIRNSGGILVGHVDGLGADGLAEKELSSGIEGKVEEKLLDVELFVVGNSQEECLDMSLNHLNIGDLVSSKLGSQHSSRVLPSLAIEGEDTITKDGSQLGVSLSKAEILELGSKDGLDVFGVVGGDDGEGAKQDLLDGLGGGELSEQAKQSVEENVLSSSVDNQEEEREVERELIEVVGLLTVPLLSERTATHDVCDSLEDEEGQSHREDV